MPLSTKHDGKQDAQARQGGVRRREVFGLSAAGATGAVVAASALAAPLIREARAQSTSGSRLQTVLERGHVVVGTDGGPRCACGKFGCLEAWLAVPRLTAQLDALDADAADAASAREQILAEAGRRLGIVLAPVFGALNLSEVVLSGPAELLDGALHDATVDTLRTRTMAEHNRDLRLRMTEQAEDVVLRGAAVMVLSGQLGVS